MKFIIETRQDDLDDEQIATVFEIVANAIRNEEVTEQMDGSYVIDTIFGIVWLSHEEEE